MNVWLVLAGILLAVLPSLYLYTVSVVSMRFPALRNKRICLLIAHPDDEAMFFAPTVLALTRPETGNHVKILCLSSGNADGLGETRKKELVQSGLILGLRSSDDVFVVESPDFQDSMTTTWSASKISDLLCSAFVPHSQQQQQQQQKQQRTRAAAAAAAEAEAATIDVLITFDAGGVSGHPNHRSLYHGARAFAAALLDRRGPGGGAGWRAPVDLYVLGSVPLARKFTGALDVAATLVAWAARTDMRDRQHPAGLVFLSGAGGVRTAWSAMVAAHRSQMVWFRWGWITLSRYMYMNSLRLEKVGGK